MTRSLLVFLGVLSMTFVGCDDKKSAAESPAKAESAASAAAPASITPKPEEAKKAPPKLVMYVDASGVSVGGQVIDAKRDDLESAVAAALKDGAFTMPDPLEIAVARQALVPTVRSLVGALRAHGDKRVVLKTATRKGDLGALPIVVDGAALKSVTATGIGKDGAIAIWPAAGGAARKKSRGFAGPDLTLGGEMLAKSVSEGGAIVYNGDAAVQWGLVFDLAMTRVEYKNASTVPVAIAASAYEPGKKVSF